MCHLLSSKFFLLRQRDPFIFNILSIVTCPVVSCLTLCVFFASAAVLGGWFKCHPDLRLFVCSSHPRRKFRWSNFSCVVKRSGQLASLIRPGGKRLDAGTLTLSSMQTNHCQQPFFSLQVLHLARFATLQIQMRKKQPRLKSGPNLLLFSCAPLQRCRQSVTLSSASAKDKCKDSVILVPCSVFFIFFPCLAWFLG